MKLIIPAAGYGTRFLPATKAIPKEMLPVAGKPVIQHIIEEAVSSGIEDIILFTGLLEHDKPALKQHFQANKNLKSHLKKFNKNDLLEEVKRIDSLANIIYKKQRGPYGNGTPILESKKIIGQEAFAVVWADDIFVAPENKPTRLKQLLEVFKKKRKPVITAYKTDSQGTKKYGIIEGKEQQPGLYKIDKLLEKPGPQKTNSRIASLGGYILTPEIFDILEKRKASLQPGQELYLSEALDDFLKIKPIYAKVIESKVYDCGQPEGWLRANIELS